MQNSLALIHKNLKNIGAEIRGNALSLEHLYKFRKIAWVR